MTLYTILNSYRAHARFLAECGAGPVGYIPRSALNVKTPYYSSPTLGVNYYQASHAVVILETAHRHWEVYELRPETPIHAREDDAIRANQKESTP